MPIADYHCGMIPAPSKVEVKSAVGELERMQGEMEDIITRHANASGRHETAVPGLHVARVIAPIAPTTQMAEASLCLCLRGSRQVRVGEGVHAQTENQYFLSIIGTPSIVTVPDASPSSPYVALRIEIDFDLARQVMAEMDVDEVQTDRRPQAGLHFEQLDVPLMDAITRLVRLIDAPRDIAFLAGLLHREILYRLLSKSQGQQLRHIVQRGSQGHRVAKAATWLRDHFRESLRIDQLAAVAGMGVSTLHRHFNELTGVSPIQYQKQLRLHEARRQMLNDNLDVGTAALNVGYESSTQFIREYRRLFGQPPLRHINSLRAGGGEKAML